MRIKRVENEKEFERAIDTHLMMEYKIVNHTGKSCMLKKGGYGSIVIHIVILIFLGWLLLIPNLLYLAYSLNNVDEVMIKIEEPDDNYE